VVLYRTVLVCGECHMQRSWGKRGQDYALIPWPVQYSTLQGTLGSVILGLWPWQLARPLQTVTMALVMPVRA